MAALQILGAVIAGIAGFLWLVMLWAGQLNRPKRAPPGSFALPVIGETLQFAIDGRSLTPHVYAEKRKAKYGPVYTTHHMGYPAVMSVYPEVNKFIMQNEGKYFVSNYPRSLRNLFGEGAIVRVYGELHKRIHNVVLSFINTSKLKEYVLADVEHMIQTPMTDWARRPVVYVEDECKTMAFNIITKYLLGLMPGEETTYLMAEYRKFIEGIISIPIKLPGTYYYRSMKAKEKCVKVMKRIMEEKRKQPQSEAKDIMSALMAESGGNGEKLSDTIICNNIMNLLGAGEETSPMAMMCAVKYITECPKALQQLREEHLAIRKSKRPGESLTWDDYTNRMTFTHYVINETLRLVNPASGVLRRAIKDVEFKGYFFPKDWLAFPYIRSVHLEESVYPDPFTFNPWRWEKKIPSMYFTPFGGGLRVCAGQELAKLEISVFLHYLVTQFTWTLHDDEQINFPAVTFKNQLPMTVKSLQH